jgi:hypothetical protein
MLAGTQKYQIPIFWSEILFYLLFRHCADQKHEPHLMRKYSGENESYKEENYDSTLSAIQEQELNAIYHQEGVESSSRALLVRSESVARQFLSKLRDGETLQGALLEWTGQNHAIGPQVEARAYDGRRLVALEQEFCDEIGKQAELLVFRLLSKRFGSRCKWVSRFAVEFGVTFVADDSLGYDLELTNVESGDFLAALSNCIILGSPPSWDGVLVIEVKGHVFHSDSCLISNNELLVMRNRGVHYVLLLVDLSTARSQVKG